MLLLFKRKSNKKISHPNAIFVNNPGVIYMALNANAIL